MVTGILCPQLVLGQNGSGSFALADNLKNLTDTVVGARLRELRDQLNHDLIPQIFALNGWDTEVTPYFDFDLADETSADDLSKYIQRIAAVGGIVFDAEMVNWIHTKVGAPLPFDDTTISIEEVREFTSSGDEPESSTRDNTLSNLEN